MIRQLLAYRERRRLSRMSGLEYAEHLKRQGTLHRIGDRCSISPRANITDPAYVSLGNNVRLSECHLFGHDGSVNMINAKLGTAYDAVGKIEIGNNVFIGHGAVVLPGTTIGDDVIVGAGAVVRGTLAGDSVYIGNPAVRVGSLSDHIARLEKRNEGYPWSPLIEARGSEFDPAMEPELLRQRVAYFFKE